MQEAIVSDNTEGDHEGPPAQALNSDQMVDGDLVERFLALIAADREVVFPLDLPPSPMKSISPSARIRQRYCHRLKVWRAACKLTVSLNAVFGGSLLRSPPSQSASFRKEGVAARARISTLLLKESAEFVRSRRGLPTGDIDCFSKALPALVRAAEQDGSYFRVSRRPAQIPLIASAIAEPDPGHKGLLMLEGLPSREARFYSREQNVIDREGKSDTILRELYDQFCFIGGSLDEFIRYHNRTDVAHLWSWLPANEVQCFGGFSTVAKKCGDKQRKLLMEVPFNYLMRSVKRRPGLGMDGGMAVSRIRTDQRGFDCAACDESNAFTSVIVPQWMIRYQGTPPVSAGRVWHLLPVSVRSRVRRHDLVSACYKRLAMGASHAVFILMQINLRIIGIALHSPLLRPSMSSSPSKPTLQTQGMTLLDTCILLDELRHATAECRLAFSQSHRTITVLCISLDQETISNEYYKALEIGCIGETVATRFWAIRLKEGQVGTISNKNFLGSIQSLLREGLDIFCWHGGSVGARGPERDLLNFWGHNPMFLGTDGLNKQSLHDLQNKNGALLNCLSICHSISIKGGRYLGDFPQGGLEGVPEVVKLLEDSAGSCVRLPVLESRKGSGVKLGSQNLCLLTSLASKTRLARALKNDNSSARDIVMQETLDTIFELATSDSGPTGALNEADCSDYFYSYSTDHFTILNELNHRGGQVFLEGGHQAIYLHVDDTLCFAQPADPKDDSGTFRRSADLVMSVIADEMESWGFLVPERYSSDNVEKAVGYSICGRSGRFGMVPKKVHQLRTCLLGMAKQHYCDSEVIRCLLGVFMFGAQLRRELMSLPHSLYRFIDLYPCQVAKLWKSARRELICMAHLLPFMFTRSSQDLSRLVFASDAMGSEGLDDCGGYGVVVTEVSAKEAKEVLILGESSSYGLGMLGPLHKGVKNVHSKLEATVPFSRLPDAIFESERWHAVCSGRWRWEEHIVLGEARSALKVLSAAAQDKQLHCCMLSNLEDNAAVSGAFSKGRSAVWELNVLCRRRAALCLATGIRFLLPWVETARQPADQLSRTRLD